MFVCSTCPAVYRLNLLSGCPRGCGPLHRLGTVDTDFDLGFVSRFPLRRAMAMLPGVAPTGGAAPMVAVSSPVPDPVPAGAGRRRARA